MDYLAANWSHYLGDLGIAIILLVLRAAAKERKTLIDGVNNALAVIKELQAWRVVVDNRLLTLEQKQGDYDRRRQSDLDESRGRRNNR